MRKSSLFIVVLFVLFSHSFLGQQSNVNGGQFTDNEYLVEDRQVFEALLLQEPTNIVYQEKLAEIAGHQEDWDTVINIYKELSEKFPENAEYHYRYGGGLGMKAKSVSKLKALGLIGDVKKQFHKAAALDPAHIDTRWALVELYIALPSIIGGSKEQALKYADELLQLSPVDGYLAKGYVYEYSDRLNLAEDNYKKAVAVGGSVTCYEKLAGFYELKLQSPIKAIAVLDAGNTSKQRNQLHYQLGKVAAMYNIELDKGQQCLLRYIDNYKVVDGVPLEWAYYRMAQINRHKKNKQEALVWIDKAMSLSDQYKEIKEERERIMSL